MGVYTCFGGRHSRNNHNNYDQSNNKNGKDARRRKAYRNNISRSFGVPLQFGE